MAVRRIQVSHRETTFDIDYDTDDGFEVFKFQLFSLTSIPPDEQKIVGGDEDRVLSDDSDLAAINEKVKLLSINGEEDGNTKQESSGAGAEEKDGFLKSDEELARLLEAEEEALMLQEFAANHDSGEFEGKIRSYLSQVLMYEDPVRQEAAQKTVPVEELEEKALISLAKDGNFKPTKAEQDHAFLLQLLFWFKESFSWVHAPPCDGCGNDTILQGMGGALPTEFQYGTTQVELYRCKACASITRFPRYNDPLKLLETRKGRCGEWANCFTLYCRAFGYQSRLTVDFTDHVWTECFSQLFGRWIHLDPCEGECDRPLLYERGWKKKLNYVIGIAKDGVLDVTKRYTRKWPEVLSRRNFITELALSAVLNKITKECRCGFTSQDLSILEDLDKRELEELERDLYLIDDASVSLPGRQSGDKEWRISRSEIRSSENSSFSGSFCPTRVCIDEHVTKVYDAISLIFSRVVENSLSKSRVTKILRIFIGVLMRLKKSSYKTRRTFINPFLLLFLPYFDELLDVLSLKSTTNADGQVDICLAHEPIKTSLPLPVVLDALDDVVENLNKCENLSKASLSFPLLKLNRIHSGLVLASGEGLPWGIATSAFDGLRTSKWEEPDGAKGCWIVYKLPDNRMHELVAYEITSANDVPKRDPMDWVVEGSNDGGSTWHILDKQTSQVFENRFQRRSFKVRSAGFLCNAFRICFLAVRDAQSNSRLQLGAIDLYSSSD